MAREIIYWRGRGEERLDLVNAFATRGYQVHTLRSLDQILSKVTEVRPVAIIVDASSADTEASERLVELMDAKPLYDLAVLFISRRATERVGAVQAKYKRLIPVDFPFKLDKLFLGLEAETLDSEIENREAKRAAATATGSTYNADPTDLRATFGGELLSSANKLSSFNDDALLPDHPAREKISNALIDLTEKDKNLGLHARRTAFVSAAIANKLGLGEENDASIRTSGLLLNWSSVAANKTNPKVDLLGSSANEGRSELADLYRRSADLVESEVGDPGAVDIMRAAADILLSRASGMDDRLRKNAQCVLITELTDRACWKGSRWDQGGAYRVVHNLRKGDEMFPDREVVTGMGRVLGEAIMTSPLQAGHKPTLTANERAEHRREFERAQEESKVLAQTLSGEELDIFELLPGMRTIDPVATQDGQVIVPPNTLMDFDLVLRVLALAAVRKLRTPLRVVAQGGS